MWDWLEHDHEAETHLAEGHQGGGVQVSIHKLDDVFTEKVVEQPEGSPFTSHT